MASYGGLGGERQINAETQASLGGADVVALASGRYLVTWYDQSGQAPARPGILLKGRVVEADGTPVGSEFAILNAASTKGIYANVSARPGGGFLLTYTDPNDNQKLLARLYDEAGQAAGAAVTVATAAVPAQDNVISFVSGRWLPSGEYLFTWAENGRYVQSSTTTNTMAFRAARFDASLSKVGDPFVLVAANPDLSPYSTTASLGGDTFAFGWSDDNEGQVRIFHAASPGSYTQFQVSPANDGAGSGEPILLALSDGNLAAVYVSAGGDTAVNGIWAQVFTPAGVAVGARVSIDQKPWRAFGISAAALAEGGFVVTWTVRTDLQPGDGSGGAIRAQQFSNAGTAVTAVQTINTLTYGDQVQPTVEAMRGGYVVGWTDYAAIDPSYPSARGEIELRAFATGTVGTAGDDVLDGTPGNDTISGGDGSDTIRGLAGNDVLNGNAGNDSIDGGDGDDTIRGGAGSDYIQSGYGNDYVDGGDDGDSITDIGGGSDTLIGGGGDDGIELRHFSVNGRDNETIVIDAGAGNDRVNYDVSHPYYGSSAGTISLGDGDDRLRLSLDYRDTVRVTLGSGRDTIVLDEYSQLNTAPTVTDFATGAQGDVLEFTEYLTDKLAGWNGHNPFGANGYLRLVQSGADTLLQIDGDGPNGPYGTWRTLFTFQNTTASSFTAANFGGWDPSGAEPAGKTITGTDASETLTGTIGADTIRGLDGTDTINGGPGDDVIYGGGAYDNIQGGAGSDYLDGGDGDDYVSDTGGGNDTLIGGAGNDTLYFSQSSYVPVVQTLRLEGGIGNDTVDFYNDVAAAAGSLTTIDLGEGDDRLILSATGAPTRVTLGTGRDTVVLRELSHLEDAPVFTDFTPGNGGDVVELYEHLKRNAYNWDGGNPFGPSGLAKLVQSGADVLLQLDLDGPGGTYYAMTTIAVFKNTSVGAFTAANFDGYPPDGGKETARTFAGTAGDDYLTARSGGDLFQLWQGGVDHVTGGAGGDAFLFGTTLTAADEVNGGAGLDVVAIQGNYALTLGAGNLVNVETLTVLPGSDTRFGDLADNRYSYVITTVDANVAAGQQIKVIGAELLAGENFTFDGSAETDGSFFIYGGKGRDTLKGGAGADVFFMAEGRFALGDTFAGGAGDDIVVFRGSVTATLAANTLTDIETVTVMSVADTRFFGGGNANNYAIVSNDGNVAAGKTLSVIGGQLLASETMMFDGRAETDGNFRLVGGSGADTLYGGAGADSIYGGLGADTLTGGAGNDVFRYYAAGESTAASLDRITDFGLGDRIDLTRIDADARADGDQAFAWLGAGAFTGVAGQLRATASGSLWTIQGDVDGDGIADFQLSVTTVGGHQLGTGDFVF